MLWKRTVEQLAKQLPAMPLAPWRLQTNASNQITVLDVEGSVFMSFDAVDEAEHTKVWSMLDVLVTMRNNCEIWFEEMAKVGISDLGLPAKKEQKKSVFIPRIPELKIFNVREFLENKNA